MKIKARIFGKGGFARELQLHLGGRYMECELVDSREANPNDNRPTWIAIGDPATRKNVYNEHKSARIITDPIICPGVQTTVNIEFGKCVIVNLNATIGHDCVIGDFVTISPGANISGNVTIGEGCYIGSGAVVLEKVSIAPWTVIGAGAVVTKSITEPGTYVGVPAKKIK